MWDINDFRVYAVRNGSEREISVVEASNAENGSDKRCELILQSDFEENETPRIEFYGDEEKRPPGSYRYENGAIKWNLRSEFQSY